MNIHGAHSYSKQGALGAAGVRRVWAGAGPHRAQGRGHIARLPAQLVLKYVLYILILFIINLYHAVAFAANKVVYIYSGWRFGVAVTRWSRSTQLLYIEPD